MGATITGTSQNELDDATLVESAAEGDLEAFDELHARYRPLVRSVVRAEIRGGHRSAEADDVVQEVFARVWQHLGTLREPDRFRPWLLQIARRRVLDHADHSGRRPVLDGDDEFVLRSVPAVVGDPSDAAEMVDTATRIGLALGALSRRDATAITLAAQFGSRPAEIGAALGITPDHAKVVLHRARRRLRAAIR